MYVTTRSVTFQLRSQTVPDSEQSSEKRGLNCEELRDRYTVPPRGTTKQLGYPCDQRSKVEGSIAFGLLLIIGDKARYKNVFAPGPPKNQEIRTLAQFAIPVVYINR
jgi:hypothetical protein